MPTKLVLDDVPARRPGKEQSFRARKQNALREAYPEADDTSEDEGLEELEDQLSTELDEEEEEEESFIDTQEETQRTGSTRRPAKKRRKQRRGSGTNKDIDLEPSRHPLSQKFHDNRKQQRIEHHPMPPKKKPGAAPSRKSARVSAADESNRAQDLKDKENQELKEKLAALETQLKLERAASQHGKTTTNDTAMGREVAKIAKKKLWKVCKFISCDASLRKATKYVMEQLELAELKGLEGEELKAAQEVWMARYKNDVRLAINKQRNYVQQELRDFMMNEFAEGNDLLIPDVEQMEALVLRDNLDDKTDKVTLDVYETLFDAYWHILAKVSGNSYWNNHKRLHFLISSDGFGDGDLGPNDTYVTASDEAFLLTLWKNCYEKWYAKAIAEREGLDLEDTDPALQTPFTDSKKGQKRFGGWNGEGIKFYKDWHEAIKKNRESNKEYLKDVESLALARIRKAEELEEEVPEEEPKKKTGKRKAEEQPEEVIDEDDFENW